MIIPPFDHPDVIAGQGTLGLEILEQVPDVDDHRRADRRRRPHRRRRERRRSSRPRATGRTRPHHRRAGGERRRLHRLARRGAAARRCRSCRRSPTASRSYRPGELNFEIIRETVDEVVTVSEDDIARALLVLLERAKLVVEPAGAVGVAAILTGAVDVRRARPSPCSRAATSTRMLMERVIATGSRHPIATSRSASALPDRPGQLARVAELLAEANANVIEVLHTRHGVGLQISEVELELLGRDPRPRAPRGTSSRCCGAPATTPASRSTESVASVPRPADAAREQALPERSARSGCACDATGRRRPARRAGPSDVGSATGRPRSRRR